MRELNNKKRCFLLKKNDVCAIVVYGRMFVLKNTENKLAESEIPFSLFLGNTPIRVKKTCFKPILKEQECKKNMSKVLGAANYLVQIFIKCEGKYSCTKTKIEKLLSISNIKYMKDGRELFSNNIVIRGCGLGLEYDFPRYLWGNIVASDSDDMNNSLDNPMGIELISLKDINDSITLNPQYEESVDLLSDDEKADLLKVFLTFGKYNSLIIGKALDKFKFKLSESNDIGSNISMKKCEDFFSNVQDIYDSPEYKDNQIIKYILN